MVTFAEIENAIAARLKANNLEATESDLQSVLMCKSNPGFNCRMMSFSASRLTMTKQKIIPVISVFLSIKNVSVEKTRRQAVYPLIQGVVSILVLQELGLEITPLIVTGGKELFLSEFENSGIVNYQIDFRTSFSAELGEIPGGDLLKIGMEYLLKPGDDVADASDILEME